MKCEAMAPGQKTRSKLIPLGLLFFVTFCAGTAFVAPLSAPQLSLQRQGQQASQGQVLAGKTAPKPLVVPALRAPADAEEFVGASLPLLLAVSAIAAKAAASESEPAKKSVWEKVKLPIFVCLWYFFNVQYNLENKRLLKVFSAPMAISWIQLSAGIPIALLMWGSGFVKAPKVSSADLLQLTPVGAAFALGQVATVASLGSVAVSFTHVVKALEPAVNAIGSAFVLGQVFHPMVYASLAPIFVGVALASSSELSFTWFGFGTAMLSNFAFVLRNVFATKYGKVGDMGEDQTTRKTNQLAVLTFVAAAVLFPIALFIPGGLLSAPGAWAAAINKGVPATKLAYLIAVSGFYFFMYQMSSFWVLSCVPPITHSVLNTLKRVVIIVISIFVFRTPVTPKSAIGTATAIGGVLLYSLVKAHYSKKKKAAGDSPVSV